MENKMKTEQEKKAIETIIWRLDKAVTETRKKIPKGELFSLEDLK